MTGTRAVSATADTAATTMRRDAGNPRVASALSATAASSPMNPTPASPFTHAAPHGVRGFAVRLVSQALATSSSDGPASRRQIIDPVLDPLMNGILERLAIGEGGIRVETPGQVRKLVHDVGAVTFSGPQALKRGQEVVYVTERAVFRLVADGVELIEVADGIDIRRDILERMDFTPVVRDPARMKAEYFGT